MGQNVKAMWGPNFVRIQSNVGQKYQWYKVICQSNVGSKLTTEIVRVKIFRLKNYRALNTESTVSLARGCHR